MASFSENSHVFIVRIWGEPREIAGAAPEWRGVIEQIPGGERRYLKELDDIVAFIGSYVPGMGSSTKTTQQAMKAAQKQGVGKRRRRSRKS